MRSNQAGITLTEVTIVMVLAAIVTVGLVTFYVNSQATWMDASTQALAQRDATLVIEQIATETRTAYVAKVSPDAAGNPMLVLYDIGNDEFARFWWNEKGDSLIHRGEGNPSKDLGAIAVTKVDEFQVDSNDTLVFVRPLRMHSTTGQPVEMTSSMALYNR